MQAATARAATAVQEQLACSINSSTSLVLQLQTCAVIVDVRVRQPWARGVVVSHPLSMREALGSIPSVSSFSSAVLLDLGGSFCLRRPVVISPTRCCCWLGAAWLAGAGSCSCKAVAAVAVAACMQHQQLNKPRPTAADMCSN